MTASLIDLCLAVALDLNDCMPYTVTQSTATSVRATGLGNATTDASIDTYDGAWAYVNNQQRKVQTGGYVPSLSDLTTTPPWIVNPVAAQILYITHLFPIGPSGAPGEDTPYKTFCVDSLKCLSYPDVITLPMTSVDSYSLATYQFWLDRQERLTGIREPAPVAGRSAVDASNRGPRIERRGTTVYLVLRSPFGIGASGDLTLDVMRPAFTLVNGAESTEGPTQDADTVEANPEDVKCGAKAFLYHALATRQQYSPDGANWASLYATQRAKFEGLTAYDKTRQMPPAPVAQEAA